MTSTAFTRVAAGSHRGGQFAPSSHAEPTTELPATAPREALPTWGKDLEEALADRIAVWSSEEFEFDGEETTDLAEILSDADEDALVAAYGQRRADWLIETKLVASGESRVEHPEVGWGSMAGPAEYDGRGLMSIEHDGKILRSARFTDEDPPELGNILDLCPAPVCPECGRESDQDEGIPCGRCMSRRCPQCLQRESDGEDGLCSQCANEQEEER